MRAILGQSVANTYIYKGHISHLPITFQDEHSQAKSRATPLPDPRRRYLGVYSVAELLDKSQLTESSEPEYLVLWSGYSMSEATWEPESDITADLIHFINNENSSIEFNGLLQYY